MPPLSRGISVGGGGGADCVTAPKGCAAREPDTCSPTRQSTRINDEDDAGFSIFLRQSESIVLYAQHPRALSYDAHVRDIFQIGSHQDGGEHRQIQKKNEV